jgi:hypothetical protein
VIIVENPLVIVVLIVESSIVIIAVSMSSVSVYTVEASWLRLNNEWYGWMPWRVYLSQVAPDIPLILKRR